MKTIYINELPVDIHEGSIAISHSGGADSGLLLYILMQWATGPIHVYTCSSTQKNRVAPRIAYNVIDHCINVFNRTDVHHGVYHVDVQTYDSWINPLIEIMDKSQHTAMYTGITNNPPDSVTATFMNPTGLVDKRQPGIIRPNYRGKFYMPFINIDKSRIYEMYRELNIVDTLFPITRSCEDTVLKSGHCGKCWWCEERRWAFGRLE